jgi:hypothetical protein
MRDNKISSDGRWEIHWVITKDFNSYFESDTRYEAKVIHCATRKCFRTFTRDEFANAAGSKDTGLETLEFLPDGMTLQATYENGIVEAIALPAKDR